MSNIFTGSPVGRGWATQLRVSASVVQEDAAAHRINAALTVSAAMSGHGEVLLQARDAVWSHAGLAVSADLAGLTTPLRDFGVAASKAPAPEGASNDATDAINAAPTALGAGGVAIVGYNTRTNADANGPDSFAFVFLNAVGSDTVIHFSDRAWSGSSFAAAGGGDGAFTYTAGGDLAAGTVITVSAAQLSGVGIDFSGAGDTLYAYQGAADGPSVFLFAVDMADGDGAFNGSLVGTGLSVGVNAVAIAGNNASFAGPTAGGPANTAGAVLADIADQNSWTQNENSTQTLLSGPFLNNPDQQIWVAASGGGNALVHIDRDGASTVGSNLVQLYQNAADNLGTANTAEGFFHPTDIVLDTVHGKMFVADSDGSGHNRIIQLDLNAARANPGVAPVGTILYQDTNVATGIISIQADVNNGLIYFGSDTRLLRVDYDTAAQTPEVVSNLGTNIFVQDVVLDLNAAGSGAAYVVNSRILASFGTDTVTRNFIYKIDGITSASTGSSAVQMEMDPNDSEVGGVASTNADPQAFPKEYGYLTGIDIDPLTHVLYFTSANFSADHDNDSGTAPITQYGGVWSYATVNNAVGAYTNVWRQDGVNGATGLLSYIEVDPATGRYYVSDITGGLGPTPDDQGLWVGGLAGGNPTEFSRVSNNNGLTGLGLTINSAPTLAVTAAGVSAVETAGAGSGFSTPVALISTSNTSDVDTTAQTDQMAGAQVRITTGFQTGTGHVDRLTIGGATSGSVELGAKDIAFSYNGATGVLTLTGPQTFDNYETVLAQVSYSVSGDNPTNYGTAPTRTIAWSTFDGLLYSNEQTTTVTVSATNDAPINVVGGAVNTTEDSGSVAISGISVSDADADPANQDIQVTLSVGRGTLTLATNVAGGVAAGDITGNGGDDIVITGTQNEINATLAAANALTYAHAGDINGADTLTVTSSDLGQTGTGGAQSGSDGKTITVVAVNDAPTVVGDSSEAMAAIAEDSPSAGESISSLFGAQFSDAADQISGGSSANGFAGVAIIDNPASSNGVWQYSIDGGGSWLDVDSGVTAANAFIVAAGDLLRFAPAADFSGAAPQLTVHLVDDSGGVITSGSQFNLTASGVGGTTRYTSATVTLDQTVTEVNDAPTATDDTLSDVDEDSAARTISFASLLGNDSAGPANEAGQTLTITAVSNAVGGSVQIVGTDVIFTLDADFNGAASFDYTVSDDGTTDGAADPQTDVGTASFNVTSVNDAPSGTDKTVTTNEDTPYVFTVADFGFSDPADSDSLLAVIIGAVPGVGSLELNGVAVTAGQSIDVADITGGLLTYTPGLDASGDAYASFTFQVQDDGGTANGGADTDPTANVITIDVDPLNDDPVVDQGIADQTGYFDEPFTFTIPANAFEDVDGDDLDYTAQLVGGGALPSWLSFNGATGQFTGTPDETEIGTYSIEVTADDGNGGTVTDSFDIEVTGNILLYGDAGANVLAGHRGDDTVNGRAGDDTITGGMGRDVLRGQAGNDYIVGSGGGDKLQGGDGNDTLVGGFGRDVYRGGDGDDLFVYNTGDVIDGPPRESIRDFVHGDDLVDLSSIDANGAGPGDTAFTWIGDAKFSGAAGELRYEVGPHGVIVSVDIDGDETAEFQIGLAGLTTMEASDFIL